MSENLKYVYSRLVNEPFNLSLHQIAKLTDRQMFDLYFAKRDKDGQILPPANEHSGDKELTFEEYMSVGRSFGIDDKTLESEWKAKRG